MGDHPAAVGGGVRLATNRVELLPVLPDFLEALHAIETAPDVIDSWRLRGAAPAFADYEASLWHGVADQRVLVRPSNGEVLGLVQLYNVDPRLRHGWFSVIVSERVRNTGVGIEGLLVFLEHCFTQWGLRQLLATVLEENYGAFSSGLGRVHEEAGVLRERVLLRGEPHDVRVIVVTPATFARTSALIRRAMARAERAGSPGIDLTEPDAAAVLDAGRR